MISCRNWSGLPGQRVAAIAVSAQGAVSLRIAVRAVLPPGASVQVFDGNGQPHGSVLAPQSFEVDAPVWLPSVDGDTLTVQIAVPSAASIEALSFTVATVANRFALLTPRAVPECPGHVDIACVSDQSRRGTADGVGQMEFEDFGGTFTCTGTLLNVDDVPDVFEPYFLTAHHCVSTDEAARTVEAWWFYQRERCGRVALDDRYSVTYSGARLLATSLDQDSTLLRLEGPVPSGVSYSGWSADPVDHPSAVYGLHHPDGQVMKYSAGTTLGNQDVLVTGLDTLRKAAYT